ncbi:MAG: UDP-N-acetyl glucosamine 2-epimerase, partial [Nannocystaceae bacterium]|nr:UDP-N-acetyl glucosamine 2-epimerase [Nannocystaceae bacterium]
LLATKNVRRLPPLDHRELLWLLRRCRFAITDSGGIQEEAPSVGVPVLVTRRATERPEALERGWAKLVGWDPERIEQCAHRWLRDEGALLRARPSCNPYGDGRAATRCVQALRCLLGLSLQAPAAWTGPAIAA